MIIYLLMDEATGIIYPSMSAAAEAVGGKIAMISSCVNGNCKTAYGRVFKRVEEEVF